MKKLTAHIFICTNERPCEHPRGCCQAKGSEALLAAFKAEIARLGLAQTVRVQKTGCLDVCEYGPALVIYPSATWYGSVTPDAISEILKNYSSPNQPLEPHYTLETLKIPGK